MKRLALATVALAALAIAPSAAAGGMAAWAVSGPQAGIQTGDVWVAQLRVVGCIGQGIAAAEPTLVLLNRDTGQRVRFRGKASGPDGHYTARVVFPSSGAWSYRVNVGGWMTGQTHGPFTVAQKQVAPTHTPDRLVAALPPVGAALLVLGTGLALRRRRRP